MRYLLVLLCFFWTLQIEAADLLVSAPKRYTVQRGDTLWDIANKYLAKPWEWRELWRANPHIKNPQLLYPGAVLELRFQQKNPYLRVLSNGTIKLSPYMRPVALEDAIPAIPLLDIKPFLNASLVMDQDRLSAAPYVVALMGEHMLGGQGDEVYVKNLHPSKAIPAGTTVSYAIYRPGCPYTNPFTHEFLGFKATMVGYGELVRGGEPATILLTEIVQGIQLNDRVMYNDYPEFKLYFDPKTPRSIVMGSIIDLPPAYTQGAVGLVAIIDQGQNAGLEAGDVLAIYSKPKRVPDPQRNGNPITTPPERVGELMIFRTFSKTSFALVVRSISTIHLMDTVSNP